MILKLVKLLTNGIAMWDITYGTQKMRGFGCVFGIVEA